MDSKLYKLKVKFDEDETININSGWEIDYWCIRLDCSIDELKHAANEVGSDISKIKVSISLTRKGNSL